MSQKNSIVEEALISMQNLEEAIAENAKGILASTMKQEIKDLVKESLKEQETEDEEEVEVDTDTEVDDMEDDDMEDLDSEEDSEEEDSVDDLEMDDTDVEVDMDTDSDETIDLTGVSDEELIKVFKAMKDEDGIIVKKDGDSVHLQDDGADVEYMIKLGESEMEHNYEMDEEDDFETDNVEGIMNKVLGKEMDETWEDELDEMDSDLMQDPDKLMDYVLPEEEEENIYEISMNSDEESEEDELYEESEEDEDELYEESEEDEDELYEESEEDEDELYEESEEDEEDLFESKKSLTIKPKGQGFGNSGKFSYKQTKGGFKEKMPQGTRGVGMGKVKKSVFTQPAKKSEAKEGMMKKPKGVGIGKGPKFEYKETTKGQMKKVEPKEASRTLGSGRKWGRKGLDKPRTSPRHIQLESELISLREKNEEYRKALNIFREKLNEVAVFNSNLAYATRLFTEHTTSKQEKLNILRRFDGAESLKESKSLYKTIKNELSDQNKPMIKESIENKIDKVQQTGSSINLMESTTYQNPQFMRMKDLMSKLK
jgi:hypothetical protein